MDHVAGRMHSCCYFTYPGYADGIGTATYVNRPRGASLSSDGQWLYWSDEFNHRIRRMATATRVIATVAGDGKVGFNDGPALFSSFENPCGTALSSDGKRLYIADMYNHKIRMLETGTSVVSTVASSFNHPVSVTLSLDEIDLYVSDWGSCRIQKVVLATGAVSTIAGDGQCLTDDGALSTASFNRPAGICMVSNQLLYVTELSGHTIRKVDLANGRVSTIAGDGQCGLHDDTGSRAFFCEP